MFDNLETPTEPQFTTPLPQAEERSKPNSSIFFNQNKNTDQAFEKKIGEIEKGEMTKSVEEQADAPKSIGGLLKSFFK